MVSSSRLRPGMSDVARLAGVSHQTVSRVLNNHPNVRAETREKVLQAISELGYRRNSAARALVTQRSATLGIVTSGSGHYGPAQTLAALEQSARTAGFFVTVATAPSPSPELMAEVFGSFMNQAVEGVVVIAHNAEVAQAARLASAQVPVMLIASEGEADTDIQVFGVDQARGARMVARHLLDLGHRDLVQLTGPPDWFDARARVQGWHAELAQNAVQARPDLAGDWTAGSGYAAGRALLNDLPTAVFAANDQMALGLLRAFAEAGVAVPDRVSVVGFDDIVGSDHFYPPLTTVRQDFDALGRGAIERLLDAIAQRPVSSGPVVPELVIRASAAEVPV